MAGILRLIWYEDEEKAPKTLEGTIEIRTRVKLDDYREDARSILLEGETATTLRKALGSEYRAIQRGERP